MARRTLLASTAAALLATLTLFLGAPAASAADPVADEQAFVALINDLRSSKGLAPLAVHDELTSIARSWAAHMAAEGSISHNPGFSGQVKANWQKLGENVGMGPSVGPLHQAFIDSPGHYRNLVDADFGHVGIGVVYANGTLFVAEQFMQLAPEAAPAPPAPAPTTTARPARAAAPATAPAPLAPAPAATPAPQADPVAAAAGPSPDEAAAPTRIPVVLEQLHALDASS